MIQSERLKPQTGETYHGWGATLSAFAAMVRKEFTIMLRYPVEFVASFGQIFLIIAVLTMAGAMFAPGGLNFSGISQTSGLVVYGFVLFIYLSDTLWSIGYNVRREQKQGTLEQLYLSPASKLASLSARVTITLFWTGLLSIGAALLMQAMIGKLPFHNPLLGLYVLAMALLGTFGTGFAFAAWTLRIKDTADTMASLFQFVFMILCAPFFPFAALPAFFAACGAPDSAGVWGGCVPFYDDGFSAGLPGTGAYWRGTGDCDRFWSGHAGFGAVVV